MKFNFEGINFEEMPRGFSIIHENGKKYSFQLREMTFPRPEFTTHEQVKEFLKEHGKNTGKWELKEKNEESYVYHDISLQDSKHKGIPEVIFRTSGTCVDLGYFYMEIKTKPNWGEPRVRIYKDQKEEDYKAKYLKMKAEIEELKKKLSYLARI